LPALILPLLAQHNSLVMLNEIHVHCQRFSGSLASDFRALFQLNTQPFLVFSLRIYFPFSAQRFALLTPNELHLSPKELMY